MNYMRNIIVLTAATVTALSVVACCISTRSKYNAILYDIDTAVESCSVSRIKYVIQYHALQHSDDTTSGTVNILVVDDHYSLLLTECTQYIIYYDSKGVITSSSREISTR